MKLQKWIPPLITALAVLAVCEPALAQEAAGSAQDFKGLIGLGAGLGIGIAAAGGGIGQGLASKGALEGIARNPGAYGKIFIPLILGLALIESLVIYALLVTWMLKDKIII